MDGSFSIANAWSGLWGPFLLYGVAYLRGYSVTLPVAINVQALELVLAFLGSTWIAVFAVRLIRAPAILYWSQQERIIELELESERHRQQRADLTVSGPHVQTDSRYYEPAQRWTIKVRSVGAAARNVYVRLNSITPEPGDTNWTRMYPYPVFPDGTITNDTGHTAVIGRQINPDDEQIYEIAHSKKSEGGHFTFVDINTRGGGHNDIQISADERWQLSYEVVAENAARIVFILEMFIENGNVRMIMA